MTPILTQQDVETPRSAAEMSAWVDAAHARFNTKSLRAAARFGKHFADLLVLEARPMELFAHRYYRANSQVIVRYFFGDQNYDGVVEDNRGTPDSIRYIEMTTTQKTYEDSLRMELLNKQGHVAAYGPVSAQGPRRNRISISAEGIAREHNSIRADHLSLVHNVIDRKSKKEYNVQTALVDAVDDSVAFSKPDDVHALDDLANTTLLPLLTRNNFCLLVLEGSVGLILVYPIQ